MSYWDTSALGKLYVPESDSAAFAQRAAGDSVIVSCQLARFEMHRIAFRKESDGLIPAGTAEEVLTHLDQDIAAGEIRLVETDSALEASFSAIMAACYRRTPPLPLRTFDAIHLAAARVSGQTEMVATDKRLREAAVLLGLSVYPL